MFNLVLSLAATTVVAQGKTQLLTSTTKAQAFQYNIPLSSTMTYLNMNLKAGSSITMIICKKVGQDCTNTPADIAYGPTTLSESHTVELTIREAKDYYMVVKCMQSSCEGNFTVDTGVFLNDHQSSKVSSQVDASGRNFFQFLLYSCLDKNADGTGSQPPISIDNPTVQGQVTYYLSRDSTNVGFPSPTNCVESVNTMCGKKEIRSLVLGTGIWRIYAIFDSSFTQGRFRMDQTPFYLQSANGIGFFKQLSMSAACSFYVELDISKVSEPFVTSLAGIAQHTNPLKDGHVDIETSYSSDFVDGSEMYTDGSFSFQPGADMDYLKNNGINTLYLKVVQGEADRIYQNGAEKFTTISLITSYNMKVSQVGTSDSSQLVPIQTPVSSQSDADREAGTRRYAYNFYYHQPEVTAHQSLDTEVVVTGIDYYYTFRTLTSKDVGLDNYVSWKQVGTATEHLGTTSHDFSDSGYQMATTMIPAGTSSDETQVAYGESLFSTVQLYRTGDTTHTRYLHHTVAATVMDVQGETTTELKNPDVNYLPYHYFKFHPTTNTKLKGGWNFVARSTCPENTMQLFYSFVNALPDDYEHFGVSSPEPQVQPTLVVDDDKGRDVYVSIKAHAACESMSIDAYPMGELITPVTPDLTYTAAIHQDETLQYEFQMDGSIYNQFDAFIKMEITEDIANSPYTLEYAITSQMYMGDAASAPTDIVIQHGMLVPRKGTKLQVLKFKNKYAGYIYLTVTRVMATAQATDDEISFRFQVSHPTGLIDDRTVKVPHEGNGDSYMMLDVPRMTDFRLAFSSDGSNGEQLGTLYIMPYAPEFIDDLSNENIKTVNIMQGSVVDFMVGSEMNHVGLNFFLFRRNNLARIIKVTSMANTRITLAEEAEIKMDGEGPVYASVKVLSEVTAATSLVLTLNGCDNCAICIGFSSMHARLDPFKTDLQEQIDCAGIVGRIKAEYEADVEAKTYQTQVIVPIAVQEHDLAYLTIISLDAEGIVEQVDFTVDQLIQSSPDKAQRLNMKYSEDEYEGVDPDSEQPFFSQVNMRYVLRCADLLKSDYSSFTVAPDLNDASVSMQTFIQAYYDVYISSEDAIPGFSKSSYLSTNEGGITVLTIPNSDLNKSCPENPGSELSPVYVQVVAGAEMLTLTPTRLYFNSYKEEEVIHPLTFSTSNYISPTPLKTRKMFHFDVETRPLTFTVAACRGWPMLRAGTTDFYLRSTFLSEDFNYARENTFKSSYDSTYGEDVVFTVKPSTRYSSLGDYILEVGDWRDAEGMQYWSADFYAGNVDPRPGTPIRITELGYEAGKYQMRFAPGIPLGKSLTQADLEYTFYILPDFGDMQSFSYNPNQACGLRQGGFQMAPWTTFPEYQDKFVLTQDCDQEKLDQYIQGTNGITTFDIAVVVRQKDTQLTKAYKYIQFDISNPPAPLPINSNNAWIVTVVCASIGSAVALALIVWLVIFLVQRHKAKNPYAFVQAQ